MSSLPTAPAEPARTPLRRSGGPWVRSLVVMVALGVFVAATGLWGSGSLYGWIVFAVTAVWSTVLAVVDERTSRLPNWGTVGLGVFGAVQVGVIASSLQAFEPVTTALWAGGLAGAVYGFMASVGWCGFGDAKFAAALALTVAPFAGFLAVYIVPLAFVVSAVRILFRRIRRLPDKHPHGASIAVAGVAVLAVALLVGPVFWPA